jgi:nucleotide-binding universal stress UspA family protein
MKTTTARTKRQTPLKAGRTTARPSQTAKTIDLVPALVKIKSILVPIDFSDTSKKALHYAVRMAEQFGATITLLNVVEPVATPDFAYHPLMLETDQIKAAAKTRLEAVARQLNLPEKLIERTVIRYGAPFAEITEAARSLKVDLIIVTTHGYTGLKHVFMGSTAERVVRHAPCPVLTVRQKEHEFV